jgi:DivIVA domain-containing protein
MTPVCPARGRPPGVAASSAVITVLGGLGVLAVLFAAAVVATRSDPLLADSPPDRPELVLPDAPMTAQDVAAVRFSTALRGYRMDEVDAVLDRLAAELADREARLAALEGRDPLL